MPADAFWLPYMGWIWCEVDEDNLFRVEFCLRNVTDTDPFVLL